MYVLLSRTQAGPGRIVKQEQEEISRSHVQTFIYLSVPVLTVLCPYNRFVIMSNINGQIGQIWFSDNLPSYFDGTLKASSLFRVTTYF